MRITGKNDRKTSKPELITMILLGPTHYIVFLSIIKIDIKILEMAI